MVMMHDYVDSHRDRAATTESFKAIVEKHMTKSMDLQNNRHLDWFFNEWVYGTQVPRYHFEYELSPAESGKVKLHTTITQSEVDEHFAMVVPIFADFGKGMIPVAQIPIVGNSTRSFDILLPIQPKKVALNPYKEILEL
jgi:aminopeptidase N